MMTASRLMACHFDNLIMLNISLLDRETILHDLLLPGDNGETFPNPLSHYLMKQHG